MWVLSKLSRPYNSYFQDYLSPLVGVEIGYSWQVLLRYLERDGILKSSVNWRAKFFHDVPKFACCILSLADEKLKHLNGAGSRPDFETALSKAIGEVLERFFLAKGKGRDQKDLRRSTVDAFKKKRELYLPPDRLDQFMPDQRSSMHKDYNEKTPFLWVPGKEYSLDKAVWIPAQMVSLQRFLSPNGEREPVIREQNTNAAAGGFTLDETILSAVYEAIERDSFLVYWLNNQPPQRVNPETCPNEAFQRMLRQVRRYRFEPVFLKTTTDIGVPACVCVLIDRGNGGPRLSVGAGAGNDPAAILLSAMMESLTVQRSTSREFSEIPMPRIDEPFRDKTMSLGRRINLWRQPQMFPNIEAWLTGDEVDFSEAFPNPRRFGSPKDELSYLANLLGALGPGYKIYYYEYQDPVLKRIGYHVVKVIIPELVHMYLTESDASIGAKRLRSAPVAMGYTPAEKPNPWPHPFP